MMSINISTGPICLSLKFRTQAKLPLRFEIVDFENNKETTFKVFHLSDDLSFAL